MRNFGSFAVGVVFTGSLMMVTSALAGGFAIREQSTTGLGAAFADSAAGSDLSSMYWNPAAVTTEDGLNSLSSFTAIIPDTTITPTLTGGTATDIDTLGLLAGSYYNYQINRQLYVGLSINAPFGLVTKADDRNWGGAMHNVKSEILTINGAPTVGYKITPELSVAAGLQIQYFKVRLASRSPTIPSLDVVLKGDDIAVGFTAGLLYKSEATGTSMGLGYRSTVKHKLEGTRRGLFSASTTDITAGLDTPEMVTASIRQEISPGFAVMANFEWSNWSRMKQLKVDDAADGVTRMPITPFDWNDSWFVSGGAEVAVSNDLTLRGGMAYEKTPVPDQTRDARLPDSDRVWLSFGASYKWNDSLMLDFGYSHIFFQDTKINQTTTPMLIADVENSANIISLGLRQKW